MWIYFSAKMQTFSIHKVFIETHAVWELIFYHISGFYLKAGRWQNHPLLRLIGWSRSIVCLIIIVNFTVSWYFKYYFTYDHFFFTVRSPCHTAWPDPKSSWYVHYLVKYRCLKIISLIRFCRVIWVKVEGGSWFTWKEYFHVAGLLYCLRMQCLNC